MGFHYKGKRISAAGLGEGTGKKIIRLLFFPLEILLLELVLHIRMGASLTYVPVWLVFSLAAGLFFAVLTLPFPPLVNEILFRLFSLLLPLTYVVEMVAKAILQSYYPLSFLNTAAENRLTDYLDVIVPTVVSYLPVILLCFVPPVLSFLLLRHTSDFARCDLPLTGAVLAGVVVLHLGGLLMLRLPWEGDLTPRQLYASDTNLDDQVEQLGLCNMLRLDVKHMFFPPSATPGDFSGMENLPGSGSGSGSGSAPGSASASVSASAPPEPAPDTSPNVTAVDLVALGEGAPSEDIRWLCEYFNRVTPTKKNEYTGMFEGYNVIFFTLEGFSGYAIDPELTPTLYRMTHEGFVFPNFYTALHFTSTSGGECQNLLGLYPKGGSPATLPHTGDLGTNLCFSLSRQLGRKGYQVLGYHANSNMYNRDKSHPNLGYDWHQFGMGFDNLELSEGGDLLWPQRDSYMIEASVDDYLNSDTPFHVYYLTISGHMPYVNNRIVAPYRETVRSLPYSETTQNYIATAMEVDRCMETLIEKLRAAGKLENTLIVAAPDHIPYFDLPILEELAGKSFGDVEDLEFLDESAIDFDVYRNSLIIWSASMKEPVEVDKVCCQVDILPTVSNLLGLEYDSRMLHGTDILSDSEGLVIFSSRCWKSDRGFYSRFQQTFTPAEGVTMSASEQESYVESMRTLVSYRLESTDRLIESNFYDYVYGDGGVSPPEEPGGNP